mmetsp:Transcript_39491/g.113967  ORF Transcript_39491/g.113967 Transcript_39491/m.113967 type:complete len:209 (-) Transcript_39491:199-825(-)
MSPSAASFRIDSCSFALAVLALPDTSLLATSSMRSSTSIISCWASGWSGYASKHLRTKSCASSSRLSSLAATVARSKAFSWVGFSSNAAWASCSAPSHCCCRSRASARLEWSAACSVSSAPLVRNSRARVHCAAASSYRFAAKSLFPCSFQAWPARRAPTSRPSWAWIRGAGNEPLNFRQPVDGGTSPSDWMPYRGLRSCPMIQPYVF